MSFAALVVVGDEAGHVGFGTGKAKEVPNAIKKAVEAAKNNLIRVPLIEGTLPHELIGVYGAGRVLLKPAAEGTGVIAGGAVRAILQSLGVHNVRTKILGSNNPHNVIRATFDGLTKMKDPIEVARLRGKQVEELFKIMAKKTETQGAGGEVKIQYYRSSIGYAQKQKDIVKSLGITKLNQTVTRPDSAATRGIVKKVPHLLRIVD